MKRERRHELEQNELADWLAKMIEAAKPYQNAILGVVLLAVVATVGYSWWARQSADKSAASWNAFHQALSKDNLSPSDFQAVIDDYPDTAMADWARTIAGDLHLALGCNALFVNKAIAKQELREAVDRYLEVLQDSRNDSMLLQRATFGLARALEAQGDLEGAMRRYEELGNNWPNGTYAAAAARRLRDLKKPATRLMYDRFAKFDPRPAYSDEPGTPGNRLPFDFESLPDDGPLFEPKMKLDLEQQGAKDDKSQDTPEMSTEPAGAEPDATDTEAAESDATKAATGPKPTDTDAADPEAAQMDPAKPAATKSDPTDTKATEPADPVEPPAGQDD